MNDHVNFLFFITDQHRADHLGCYGNKVVKTPNLDKLAARGQCLTNMHVATPICMPNRASLMTGRYPTAHGARHNGIPLSLQARTFVETLRESGYRTAVVGKIHLQNMTDIEPIWPPVRDPSINEAFVADSGNYDQEKRSRWLNSNDYDLDYPYYGFEQAYLVDDHADIVHGHYRYWLRQNVPDGESLIGPENALPAPEYELVRLKQAWRTRLSEEHHPSAYIADRTMDLLAARAQDQQPFFIQCSFPDPHHPFTPPGRFWDMYTPEDMQLPNSFHSDHPLPEHLQWLYAQRDTGKANKGSTGMFACTEREAKEALALNYGSISFIDEQIGRVMQRLQALGLDKNTVVVFTSDHGDFLGDHQLMLKGPVHYRGLTRVPFIWSDPASPATTIPPSSTLSSTIDVAPTILARAGVKAYNGIQGKNLMPVLQAGKNAVRDALLIEEEGQRVILGIETRVRCRTLLTERYRMTIYDAVDWGELYDLNTDPDELQNLWNEPAAGDAKAMMMQKLAYANLAHAETSPYPTALA